VQQELTGLGSLHQTIDTNTGQINSTIVLSDCEVSLREPYFWRDWQPDVLDPGPDGGSPLRVAVVFEITNLGDVTQQIAWGGSVRDGDDNSHPVQFTDRSQTPQKSVTLLPGQNYMIDLISRDGPYLPVGSKVALNLSLTVDGKGRENLTSTQLFVNQTM